jgi:hypothetical protein
MSNARSLSRSLGAALLGSALLCAACGSGATGSVSGTASSATPTATPTPLKRHAIGDLVTIGTAWQIRITGFRVLGPGDTPSVQQVGIDMTLKNLGTQPSSLDDNYMLTFADSLGRRHGIGQQTDICRLSTGAAVCLDALTLGPSASQSGDLGAVVLVGPTQYTLTLDTKTGVGNAGEVIWALSL